MTATDQPKDRRILSIDVARGVALIAMAIYHGAWDLEMFGYLDPGTVAHGGWKMFARCIASTFLFLVGVSLFLAHGRQIRWRGFAIRLAMVAAAAALITAATLYATPEAFIFFGILHQIALASLLGLAFLRLPAMVSLVVATLVILAPIYLRATVFDHPALWWVGLSTTNPRSNDYVPLFPWFAPVLIGIAAAKLATDYGQKEHLAAIRPGRWSTPLLFAGRHSLAFYLIHQPVLIGLVWLATQIVPPPQADPEVGFNRECRASCIEQRDATFCTAYCGCMLESLRGDGSLDRIFAGESGTELQLQVEQHALACTGRTDYGLPQGGTQ
ncbi:DUF1624 domain-containing protein [Corticibacterium sp. UT-5YL-CI-8]|nr:DUF1624 domain-containing protein [Tianweitania sp. UT-5YL-CI-8]